LFFRLEDTPPGRAPSTTVPRAGRQHSHRPHANSASQEVFVFVGWVSAERPTTRACDWWVALRLPTLPNPASQEVRKSVRQASSGKEEETRTSETFHRHPAGTQSRPAKLGQAAGSESCVVRSDPHCEA